MHLITAAFCHGGGSQNWLNLARQRGLATPFGSSFFIDEFAQQCEDASYYLTGPVLGITNALQELHVLKGNGLKRLRLAFTERTLYPWGPY